MKFQRDAVRVRGIVAALGMVAAAAVVGCGGDSPATPAFNAVFPVGSSNFTANASGTTLAGQTIAFNGISSSRPGLACPAGNAGTQAQVAAITPTFVSVADNGQPQSLAGNPTVIAAVPGDTVQFTATTPTPVSSLAFSVLGPNQPQSFILSDLSGSGQILGGQETINGSFTVPATTGAGTYTVQLSTQNGSVCTNGNQQIQIVVQTGAVAGGTGQF